MQTLDNGIEVPTNSDDYALTEDLANMGGKSNVVTIVADKTARNALTKYEGRPVYRLDISRVEVWNGARWAVTATTELGHDYTSPLSIAGVDYATVATVNCESLGGKLKLSYTGVVENANSGANRTVDVQWLIDGAPFGGVTYNSPLVTGFANPATSVAFEREYTAAAGAHVIELQTRANVAGAVRNVLFSHTVKENP
jgi:hypothetical protein